MEGLHLSLALFFLLSSPVQAQWFSLFWAKPKSDSFPPSVEPSIDSPSITSLGPSDIPVTTEVMGKEDWGTEATVEGSIQREGPVLAPTPTPQVLTSGHSTAEPGILPPEDNAGGGSKTKSQYKPLKHWRTGECYRAVKDSRLL